MAGAGPGGGVVECGVINDPLMATAQSVGAGMSDASAVGVGAGMSQKDALAVGARDEATACTSEIDAGAGDEATAYTCEIDAGAGDEATACTSWIVGVAAGAGKRDALAAGCVGVGAGI